MPTIQANQVSSVAITGAIVSTDGPDGGNPGVNQTLTPSPASGAPMPAIEEVQEFGPDGSIQGSGTFFSPPVAGDTIVLQNQANPANNGVWNVTSDGTDSPPNDFWLLTRHPDADEPSDWPVNVTVAGLGIVLPIAPP